MQWCCFGYQLLEFVERNEGLAAWVQAIGALLSIGAVFLIARAGERQALRRDARARELAEADADAQLQAYFVTAFVLVENSRVRVGDVVRLFLEHPEGGVPACRLAAGGMRAAAEALARFDLSTLKAKDSINTVAWAMMTSSRLENQLLFFAGEEQLREDSQMASAEALKAARTAEEALLFMKNMLATEIFKRWPEMNEDDLEPGAATHNATAD